MSGQALERVEHDGRAPAVLGEREIASLEFQARGIAALDNRLTKLKPEDRKEKAIALAITLHNLGLPVTVTNAKKLHLIQGEVMESAQLLVGLLERCGHEVRVVEEGDERAVVRGWRHGGGEPHEVTYTIDQARRSGALDEWVELWEQTSNGNRKTASLPITRDGEEINRPLPSWAEQQVNKGRVKRYDAWHNYRSDMLVNRAIRRLAKRMGGDALLGISDFEDEEPPQRMDPPVAATVSEPDEDIDDAEVVEEPRSPEPPAADPPLPEAPAAKGDQLNLDPERPFTE